MKKCLLFCLLLTVLGCAGGLEPEERENFEMLFAAQPNGDFTWIDEHIVFDAVSEAWLEEYPGVIAPVRIILQYEPIEMVQTRTSNLLPGTLAYGVAVFDGTKTNIYIVDTLQNDFALLVLAHEIVHAFEFASGVVDDNHSSFEVWGEGGVLSRAVEKANMKGAILGQQTLSVTWLESSE